MASPANTQVGNESSAVNMNGSFADDNNVPTSSNEARTSDLSETPTANPRQVLDFARDDKANPRNWSEWIKWRIVLAIGLLDLTVSWTASGYCPGENEMMEIFHTGEEIAKLGLSVYILGLAFGPMTLAPLSEHFGRSPIYIGSYFVYLVLSVGILFVQSLSGFLILRFLTGLFIAVTISNFGGTIADLWETDSTGPAMGLYIWAATTGSPSGNLLFSIVQGTRGFRATFQALLGISTGLWIIMIICIKETRHSVLLDNKSKNNGMVDDGPNVSLTTKLATAAEDFWTKALTRPFHFIAQEAIVQFSAAYNGFLYGLTFLFNTAFVIVFGPEGHGFNTIVTGQCFAGVIVGILIGVATNAFIQEPYYQKQLRKYNSRNLPEARVMLAKVAGITLPISLFWFAWTSDKSIHPVVPILASALWGWSFYTLILMTFTYTEDAYMTYSASALAAIGFVRNIFGAAFPLFGKQMFHGLGTPGAVSLLGGLAVILIPIPFVLAKYGKELRKRSPWAKQHMETEGTAEDGSDIPKESEEV